MGINNEPYTIAEALFTRSQRKVLALLFGNPERSYYTNDILRRSGTGIGAVQRVLEKFTAAELLTVTRIGNQKHYQANPASPVFGELQGMARKFLHYPPRAGAGESKADKLHIPMGALRKLCHHYGVRRLALTGAAARGQLASDGAVELLVELGAERVEAGADLARLRQELTILFSRHRVLLAQFPRKRAAKSTAVPSAVSVLFQAE